MIRSNNDRRIVVTGIGVMTPIGQTVERFWKALTRSASATRPSGLTGEKKAGCRGAIADFQGLIDDFGELPKPVRKALRKALKVMNRETQMGVAAGQKALADSGLQEYHDPERIGVCFGAQQVSVMPHDFLTGIEVCSNADQEFDFTRWGSDGIQEVEPLWLLKCLPNMPACYLAIINDIRGHCNTITQRDIAANMAVAEGSHVIKDGDADAVLVGASGTTLHPFNLIHARLEEEVSEPDRETHTVCRPFDRHRVGPSPGEGSGALVLEEMNAAIRRGAPIYGELRGAASSCCARRDRIDSCHTALCNVLTLTLERAEMARDGIGHLHAHGMGTRDSDIAEARAINDVFGRDPSRQPRLVAAKSHLGNVGTGSGAIELIASLLALKHGYLFPLLNYDEPDPACPVTPVTTCDQEAGTSFLNVNMAGRGLASCVAVSTFESSTALRAVRHGSESRATSDLQLARGRHKTATKEIL